MKLKTMLLTTAAFGLAAPALAQDDPIELTFVSWGGAYQNSQIKAYAEPYMEMNPNVSIIWDESSADAVTKLRAMDEAGNLTWDLVDVVAADAMRLCDEGLAMVIDADTMLAPAPDGTPASEDFGDLMVSECFIPQIVYSTTFGYRGDLLETAPTQVCDIFDTETFPGRRALEKRPIANMEWALICDGVPMDEVYDVLETEEGVARAFAKLDTIKEDVDLVVGRCRTTAAAGRWRGGDRIDLQRPPVLGDRGAGSADRDAVGLADVRPGWLDHSRGLDEDRLAVVMDFLYFATDTQRLADQAKYISYGPARRRRRRSSASMPSWASTWRRTCRPIPANAQNTFLFNYDWWADYRDDLDAQFQAWLLQ
jgi:putative spermidine/putrescine transport system substrate-binding protein